MPVGALPILGTLTKEYEEGVGRTIKVLNDAYHGFLESEEGMGFCGQVCVIGECLPRPSMPRPVARAPNDPVFSARR